METSFIDDVQAGSDDGPALVFADWLEERGDQRAEYLRCLCELSEMREAPDELTDRLRAFEAGASSGPDIRYRSLAHCVIVEISDDRTQSPSPNEPQEFLEAVAGITPLVLDLRYLSRTGSAFLGALIRHERFLRDNNQGSMVVVAQGAIEEVMRIVRLNQVFRFFNDIHEAVAAVEEA